MNTDGRIIPLHLAVLRTFPNRWSSGCDHAIDRGSNINAADYDENTPLHIAVIKNNIEIVEILLDNGANSNAVNDNGSTPLHFAVSRTFQEHMVYRI